MFIGKKKDSFKKFYEDLRDKIILPTIEALPSEEELQDRVHIAIEKAVNKNPNPGEHQDWPKDPELEEIG
jgi:hypothetical protein